MTADAVDQRDEAAMTDSSDADTDTDVDTDTDAGSTVDAGSTDQTTLRKFLGALPLTLLLIGGLIWTLPQSPLKQAVPDAVWKATQVLAVQQNWAMFAPDPPDLTMDIEAVVTFTDGSTTVARVPHGNAIISSIYSERWRKWEERLSPVGAKDAWPAAAQWFGERAGAATGKTPATVSLQRHWTYSKLANRPIDEQPRTFVFFEADLKSGNQRYLDPELLGTTPPKTQGKGS